MNQTLTKELADQLMKVKGEARGVLFKTDAEFVLKEKGPEGLAKVKKELAKIGHPIDYENIKPMAFYPVGLRIISLLAIQKAFDFSIEDIKRMGAYAPKKSLIVKLFTKYFLSLNKTGEQAPKMWEKQYTIGKLSVDPRAEENWNIVRVKDFSLHPLFCHLLNGYITTVVQMITGGTVTTKETKCTFKGDPYHEYLSTW